MKQLFVLLLFIPFIASAQEKGTHFEHDLSWTEVKAKAKKENKFLLVDCYTTWCGPCKYMANTVFPQEQVGTFMNAHFVNVKVQFDTTKKDSEAIKKWYADAKAINEKYKVKGYPTFLIFSPEGELVHRIVGSEEAEGFMAKARKALDPKTQYYTQLKKFESGKTNDEGMKQLAVMAKEEAYDLEKAEEIANAYLDRQQNLYTKENLEFLAAFTQSSKSKGFQVLLKEPEKIDAVLGTGKANAILGNVIFSEEIYPASRKPGADIDALITKAKAKYKTVDLDQPASLLKVQVYQRAGDWAKFQPAVLAYMQQYGAQAEGPVLNSFAWSVFEHCDDAACVASALEWSRRSVEATDHKEPAFLDTYANLLYKTGNNEAAIEMENKAIALVPEQEKAAYQTTIDKMKKGEKTWTAPGGK